jgi:hypothetical protein
MPFAAGSGRRFRHPGATYTSGIVAGRRGDVAQLVEHLLCKQGVGGSSPLVSTHVAAMVLETFT